MSLPGSTGNSHELCHYGILGMKWGVRRTPEQLGHKTATKSGVKNRLRKAGEAVDRTYRTAQKVMATAATVASVVALARAGMAYASANPAIWTRPAVSAGRVQRGKTYINSGRTNWKKYRNFQNRIDPMLDFRQTL